MVLNMEGYLLLLNKVMGSAVSYSGGHEHLRFVFIGANVLLLINQVLIMTLFWLKGFSGGKGNSAMG